MSTGQVKRYVDTEKRQKILLFSNPKKKKKQKQRAYLQVEPKKKIKEFIDHIKQLLLRSFRGAQEVLNWQIAVKMVAPILGLGGPYKQAWERP